MSAHDPRPGTNPPTPTQGHTDDPDVLREEIAQTREELGDTVAALSDKSDVKAQASAKAEELKSKAQEFTDTTRAKAEENPMPFVFGAVGALAALMVLRRLRRRRRSAKLERLAAELAQRTLLVRATPSSPGLQAARGSAIGGRRRRHPAGARVAM
jgi:Protein of unknown function (DUF3618)